ncbi:ATP-dependent helicase [Clostridium oryzae]|uniref:DNA 3'-5' helicase n=1 Tax=Clostridium oryzae TaxID=1450648 RepID=A0A1V4ICJ8_9CLOT|nr:ATP-dependent helicase [Clostridium oryzae]OPJ57663.1 putative ATP-dependent DNA helicase YjcD [Clostridium oryzae]
MKLDDYQESIVKDQSKNMLIVASPGSGKTTVIINRVGYMIRNGIKPSSIVIITFTKAAAENMKKRYVELFHQRNIPFFGTFHSFFYRILLKEYHSIEIIDGYVTFQIVKNVMSKSLGMVGEDRIQEIINAISLYKNHCSSEENLKIFNSSIFMRCYNAYESYKKDKKLVDFDDLQLRIYKLFQDEKKLELYTSYIDYLLIDEFQDCDELQLKILELLCRNKSIFAVGDEDQCIYSFRGAKPEYMVNFSEHFKDGVKRYLINNYRSGQNIVSISRNVIENNKMRNKKEFSAKGLYTGNVVFRICSDEREQAQLISDFIVKNHETNNQKYSDNAILYRTNKECSDIIDCFVRKKIPFNFIDSEYNAYNNFICQDIISYLKLSNDFTDEVSFCKIINRPNRYVSKVIIEKLINNPLKKDCFDFMADTAHLPFFQYKEFYDLKHALLKASHMSALKAIDYIVNNIGYIKFIERYVIKNKLEMRDQLEVIKEFKDNAKEYKSIKDFIAHVEAVNCEMKNSKRRNREGVLLSSIHGVKGMEFMNVFIINCIEGNIPYDKEGKYSNIEEERRLFYVALTRAINSAAVFCPRTIKSRAARISRFIDEGKIKNGSQQVT